MTDTRIYDGNRAKEILENEVFQQAMTSIKTEINEQWQNSPARDQEGREKLWMMLKIAEKFQSILQTTLETGKLAEIDLNHKRNLLQRASEGLHSFITD